MAITLNVANLRTLGLELEELETLSEDEQALRIKKAWKRMCLLTHPDKNPNPDTKEHYTQLFKQVNQAYTELTTSHGSDEGNYDFNNFFEKTEIIIPNTAFDIPMQEGIHEAFEELKRKFRELDSDVTKRKFAKHYASFLTLAEDLESRQVELNQVRGADLVRHEMEATIGEFLTREWRMLIIRLFAEEYLDDFQYRNAIAFGDLLSILATRKLISPAKWIAAIIGGLDLLFRGSAEYCMKHEAGDGASLLYFLGTPVTLVNFFFELLASPVNNVIRPLASYTGLPTAGLAVLLAGIVASLIYGLILASSTFSLASTLLLLPYLTVALNLYSIYVVYQLVQNLKDQGRDPTDVVLFFGLAILVNFIPSEPIFDFIMVVADLCLFLAVKKITTEKPIEFLPLPDEPIAEDVKAATLLGYNKANQSHRFFGTPKDAVVQNERSFWQKTASFFGVDNPNVEESTPQFDNVEVPLALG